METNKVILIEMNIAKNRPGHPEEEQSYTYLHLCERKKPDTTEYLACDMHFKNKQH